MATMRFAGIKFAPRQQQSDAALASILRDLRTPESVALASSITIALGVLDEAKAIGSDTGDLMRQLAKLRVQATRVLREITTARAIQR